MKLYVQEHGGELVYAAADPSEKIATSTIAYAEARSALARHRRGNDLDEARYKQAISNLNEEWPSYDRLIVSHDLAYRAGELAERYALRGYDSVHLASVIQLAEWNDDVRFLAFDNRLVEAAREVGLAVVS